MIASRITRAINSKKKNDVNAYSMAMNEWKNIIMLFNTPVHVLVFKVGRKTYVLLSRFRCYFRGTQREYSSKPLKHSIVKRILVFKR